MRQRSLFPLSSVQLITARFSFSGSRGTSYGEGEVREALPREMHLLLPQDSARYLGAIAVGAVSSVLDPVLIRDSNWAGLTKRAREFINAVQAAH